MSRMDYVNWQEASADLESIADAPNAKIEPKIGLPVWRFDPERRVYRKDENGKSFGPPIWREHWTKRFIVAESRQSWFIGHDHDIGKPIEKRFRKIPKREFPGALALSEADIDRRAWIHDNRIRLSEEVRRCSDYDAMRAIDEILSKRGDL